MSVVLRPRVRTFSRMLLACLFVVMAGSGLPMLTVAGSVLPGSTGLGVDAAAANALGFQSGANTDSCTQTVSPGADIQDLVRSAANDSTICLNDGDFGTLTIDAQRSGYVTIRAVNPRQAVFDQINLDDASYIRLEQLKVRGQIESARDNTNNIHIVGNDTTGVRVAAPSRNKSAGPGPTDWIIEYNDIHDCTGFCVALASADPDSYWPVSNIVVRGNKIGPMDGGEDAFRINNWRNIVIEDNEIFGVIEDGQHNDCLQSVWGGQNLVFARNYLHDNNCQTFFLKDGYTENIVFEENLSLRNRVGDARPVAGQIYPSRNVRVRNNTIWDGSPLRLRTGSAQGPVEDYVITNNVMVSFLPIDDNQPNNRAGLFKDPSILTEDFNVFGSGWTWVPDNMGPHSVEDPEPDFINPTTSRAQDLASGDWRLAERVTQGGQTYTAGITWKLAGRLFGTDAYNNH